MSEIQAVLFDNTMYTPITAMKWLKQHNIQPMKRVHKTENKLRYRINDPESYKRLRTKQITDGISYIFGYK